MSDVLANQQIYCRELRRSAPNHTYKNDREIVESMRSILDANMQITSYDESWLIELMRFHLGVLAWQQQLLKQVTEAYPSPSPTGTPR